MESVKREVITFKHPFTCKIAGPSGCGKTNLTRDIIKHYKQTFFFKDGAPDVLKVIWAYGVEGAVDYAKYDDVDIKYMEGMPSKEDLEGCHLLILDDLMTDLGNSKTLSGLFTRGRHFGIATVFLVQNVLPPGTQMRNVTLNCHYTILFGNFNDSRQISDVGSRAYPNGKTFFMDVYEDATEKAFGYIRLDSTTTTPRKYRLQTNIVPIDGKLRPICYLRKNV